MSVASYVFIDLETTGLPKEESNKTKITEISMVAVKRDHVLETRPGASPRVQHKLTLCLNPGKMVHPDCTKVTGLCNDLLEHEAEFDINVFNIISTFLNVLTKPVCLIAQNGLHFDFPILKRHVEKLKASFSDDLLCADCYHAFYDILEDRKKRMSNVDTDIVFVQELGTQIFDEHDLCSRKNSLDMKTINETTPVSKKHSVARKGDTEINEKNIEKTMPAKKQPLFTGRISKARRRLPWSTGTKPKDSYKLKDVYERIIHRPALEAHRAENDCIMALECSVALGEEFVKWTDDNCVLFSEVKPMTIGVPLGF